MHLLFICLEFSAQTTCMQAKTECIFRAKSVARKLSSPNIFSAVGLSVPRYVALHTKYTSRVL